MRKLSTVAAGILILFFSTGPVKAQDDCCGIGSLFQSMFQSGIFGGYGYQQFSAKGLNGVIRNNPDLEQNFSDFGSAWGWRVGANVFGFRSNDIIMALKLYFQSFIEKQEAAGIYNGADATQELKLKLSNFNLGISMSYFLGPNFDIRIFDALVTWTSADFTNTIRTSSEEIKTEHKSTDTNIGFTANTGLVYYPLPPYIAIELLVGYSYFAVEKVADPNGVNFSSAGDFIDGGGFFGVAVLTVGIPFN